MKEKAIKTLNKFLPDNKIVYLETEKKDILGFNFYTSGIVLNLNQLEITGSSSSLYDDPILFAAYECMERFCVLNLNTPSKEHENFKISISNGVALHTNLTDAKSHSRYELLERNDILKSWYLNTPIKRIPTPIDFPIEFKDKFNIYCINFSNDKTHNTIGIFAIPKSNEHTLIYGYGCGYDEKEAFAKAYKEFLSRLGFLWGEEIENINNYPRNSALYHQEFYLQHENIQYIEEWILNKKFNGGTSNLFTGGNITYERLESPEWLDQIFVTRAQSKETIPLFFGEIPKSFDFPFRHDIPHPIA